MRRSSLIFLGLAVVLVTVATGLLLTVMARPPDARDAASAMTPTIPSPNARPPAEPDDVAVRMVFILSILVVFVSAILVLFRLFGKVPFKD